MYGGKWKLLHLKGTELVADGCTKPLLGQAFFPFLEDLGLKRGVAEKGSDVSPCAAHGPSSIAGPSSTMGGGTNAAVMAMAVGSLLLSSTDAAPDEDGDAESHTSWVCGALLMALGTIYLTQLSVGNHWILCREDSDDERLVVNSAEFAETSSSSFSQPMTSQSGSQVRKRGAALSSTSSAAAVAESSAAGPMSRPSSTTSGSAAAATSSATASGSAAAVVDGSARTRGFEDAGQTAPTPKTSAPQNPWNQFQHQNRGKGFSRRTMSLLYKYEKNKEDPK